MPGGEIMTKVLVVDDEKEVVDFLCNFLKRFKLESEKANDGKEAIDVYEKIRPEFTFLDIKMPQMDGLDVLREIKKINQNAKVIMITGREDKESQSKAKKLGALDYVVKPLDLEELHRKIQEHILDQI